MDEMKINLGSKLMRNLVAKLLSKTIYKKTGDKVDIKFNELKASMVNGEAYMSTSIEAKMNGEEFSRILTNIDL